MKDFLKSLNQEINLLFVIFIFISSIILIVMRNTEYIAPYINYIRYAFKVIFSIGLASVIILLMKEITAMRVDDKPSQKRDFRSDFFRNYAAANVAYYIVQRT